MASDDASDAGTECTTMQCGQEAVYAYWMPDLGQFSRARSPEHDLLDDGDLCPYVCESCRDRMVASPHYKTGEFVRPEEKLIADGGRSDGGVERGPYIEETKVEIVTTWNDEDELGERVVRYDDVRCPECGRMLFCILWEAYGYPEVHCPPCGLRDTWPFKQTGLRDRYERGCPA